MLLNKRRRFNLKLLNDRLKARNAYKNFFLFIMGMAISAIAVSVFYEPYNIVSIGSTGVSILINNYLNIDLSLLILVISSITLVISFGVFGIEYGSKCILGTILFPVFVMASTLINRIVYFENTSLFVLVLTGSLLSGIGFGLTRRSGYNMGGFNVIYDIISKRAKISVGTANVVFNSIIIALSLFVFGISECIYGFIALYISMVVADRVMIGISRNKVFYVVTKHPLEVRDYIISNLHHTVTIINARGGYSNKRKKMIMCVIPTIEYTRLKEVIREIDNDAFFLITDSYYVSKSRKNM